MSSIDFKFFDESRESVILADRKLTSARPRNLHPVDRRELLRRLHQVLASARELGSVHALACIEIDCRGAADLRRRVVESMGRRIRRSDTLAALDATRYALILHHCPLDNAIAVAEALRDGVRSFAGRGNGSAGAALVSRAVIGLVPFSAEARDTDQLLDRGRRACQEAWTLGGDRVQVFRSAASDSARKEHEILRATELLQAIEQDRLRLYGQEIVPLKPGLPRFIEALLRLPDGHGGHIPPAAFVRAAERYDLATCLDRWVVAAALASYRRLFARSPFGITINLSGQTVGDGELLDLVQRLLPEYGIAADRVCFEITETAAISDIDRAREFIVALRGLGCRFALDDFGNGHASFRYLKELDVDYLKIDRSFVSDVLDGEFDLAMIEAIARIGQTLDIRVVAEGVERRAVLDRLRQLGLDYAQGFVHGRPCALEELAPSAASPCE